MIPSLVWQILLKKINIFIFHKTPLDCTVTVHSMIHHEKKNSEISGGKNRRLQSHKKINGQQSKKFIWNHFQNEKENLFCHYATQRQLEKHKFLQCLIKIKWQGLLFSFLIMIWLWWIIWQYLKKFAAEEQEVQAFCRESADIFQIEEDGLIDLND